MKKRLGVNVDHVATLRQARGGTFPSPVEAALAAQRAGADSIVAHLREDRRHIQDRDLNGLKKRLKIPLNLEMSVNPGVVRVALDLAPDQATLVPERRKERTTESGLDVSGMRSPIERIIRRLRKKGIFVSLFVDPDPRQIEASRAVGAQAVEIHTGDYAACLNSASRRRELGRIRSASKLAADRGLKVFAGHGLDYGNLTPLLSVEGIEEFNIGFSIIAKSVFDGIYTATKEMKRLINPIK